MGIKSVDADHVASHAGKAMGLVTFLRSIPYLASQHKMVIPRTIEQHCDLDTEEIFSGQGSRATASVYKHLNPQNHKHN